MKAHLVLGLGDVIGSRSAWCRRPEVWAQSGTAIGRTVFEFKFSDVQSCKQFSLILFRKSAALASREPQSCFLASLSAFGIACELPRGKLMASCEDYEGTGDRSFNGGPRS